jgi:hypothetical protein
VPDRKVANHRDNHRSEPDRFVADLMLPDDSPHCAQAEIDGFVSSKSLFFKMVPAAGLEPARPCGPRDFKSLASTIPPSGHGRAFSAPMLSDGEGGRHIVSWARGARWRREVSDAL